MFKNYQLNDLIIFFTLLVIIFNSQQLTANEKQIIVKPKFAVSRLKIDYAIEFPNGCELKETPQMRLALCIALANSQENKSIAANLPVFIVEQQLKVKKNLRPKWTVNQDIAHYVCSSASYENGLNILKSAINKDKDSIKTSFEVICPADKYGVIKQRKGHYIKIETDKKIYRLIVRYLISDEQNLSSFANNFLASFKLKPTENL